MKIGFGMNGAQRLWRNLKLEKTASGQQVQCTILVVDHIMLRSDAYQKYQTYKVKDCALRVV